MSLSNRRVPVVEAPPASVSAPPKPPAMPAGLVGMPAHVAVQSLAFLTDPYVTGRTVHVDGGGAIA